MQMLYNLYYRQYGIRRLQQLMLPRLFSEDQFNFPKNAIYHHVSHDENDLAPNQDQSYFHNYRKRIFMDVVTTMPETKGNPRRNSTAPQILYRPFFLKNRLFKFTRDAVNVNKDPQTLTAIDYGYLQKLYRYTKVPLTPYYQWYNIEKTVWDNILKTCRESERQNFLFLKVPDVMPSLTMLRLYTNKVNNVFLHVFDTHEKRFILELWRWINPETRKESLLGGFTKEDLQKVNIVLTHNGKWTVINLGVFDNWRKEPKGDQVEEPEESVDKSKSATPTIGYYPPQFQKLMLKMFIGIQTQSAIDPSEVVNAEETEPNINQPEIHPGNETEIEEGESEVEVNADPEVVKPTEPELDKSQKLHEVAPEVDLEDSARFDVDEKLFDEIDKDLEALEYIEQKHLMMKGVTAKIDGNSTVEEPVEEAPKEITFEADEAELKVIKQKIFAEESADESLKSFINRHAEYGLMSAAEYRKLLKQSEEFMNAKSGYAPEKSIREFVKIEDHELKITKEEIQIPAIATVPDKGMLESSLITFDKKYIKNVLPKDITAMIVNIQKAGIIVQDYQIEQESGALGAYEIHTVRIKPIDGVASTLRFKLPKVDEEGNFVANGNKYHMRKQRAD